MTRQPPAENDVPPNSDSSRAPDLRDPTLELPSADHWLPTDLSDLIPDEYAAYRSPLRATLVRFLDGLEPQRRIEIVQNQLALAESATTIERVLTLLHDCPSLHKLGQVVARDRRLDASLRRRLATLESLPGQVPLDELRPILHSELGDAAARLRLGPTLAEGSVCAVVPFSEEGSAKSDANGGQTGVLKIVKPGVRERLEEELSLWPSVGAFLEERCRRDGLATPAWRETLDQVAELLAGEVDLSAEQRHLEEAHELLRAHDRVVVPERLDLSTPHVTAMTRLEGRPLTESRGSLLHRARLASATIDALIARPLLQAEGPAMFHADPHAGNLLALQGPDGAETGRVGIIDWALVERLSKTDRVHFVQIALGAITLDRRRIVRAVVALSENTPDTDTLTDIVDRFLASVRRGRLPGFAGLSKLLDEIVVSTSARFPTRLLLFRKSLLTLEGVLRDLCPELPVDVALLAAVGRQLVRDAPRRLFAWPGRRDFGTHLSNLELLGLLTAPTRTTIRFWRQTLRDLDAVPEPSHH